MSILEIVCLGNGDVVLVEASDDGEADTAQPIVTIRFGNEVRDMLGDDVVGVAEAMIDAATDYIDAAAGYAPTGDLEDPDVDVEPSTQPVILH